MLLSLVACNRPLTAKMLNIVDSDAVNRVCVDYFWLICVEEDLHRQKVVNTT
jgi:hypothetical protein